MPTYEYVCTDCGKQLEVVQSFTDSSLTVCPSCEGKLRKVFGNVGVSFKGSGFYKTDSRGTKPSPAAEPAAASPAAAESTTNTSPAASPAKSDASTSPPASPSSSKPSESTTKPKPDSKAS